jgi:hypothetical protein
VQTIFLSVNRFNFPTPILSSSILSMAMYLPRTHIWHVIFHSFHYHLVIWGHLQLVSIMFLRLINSLTIWLLSYVVLLTLLDFEINYSETILRPIPLIFDLFYPSIHLHVCVLACVISCECLCMNLCVCKIVYAHDFMWGCLFYLNLVFFSNTCAIHLEIVLWFHAFHFDHSPCLSTPKTLASSLGVITSPSFLFFCFWS